MSHHGRYVAIASHPRLLMGLDIVDTGTRPASGPPSEYFAMFEAQFTAAEMRRVAAEPGPDRQFRLFFIIWSLKESFIKAVGSGLGYDLQRINFDVSLPECKAGHTEVDPACTEIPSTSPTVAAGSVLGQATVHIDGAESGDWSFQIMSLDPTHVLTVARGPICAASESYVAGAWPGLRQPNGEVWGKHVEGGLFYLELDGEAVEVDGLTYSVLEVGETVKVRYTRRLRAISIDRFPSNGGNGTNGGGGLLN